MAESSPDSPANLRADDGGWTVKRWARFLRAGRVLARPVMQRGHRAAERASRPFAGAAYWLVVRKGRLAELLVTAVAGYTASRTLASFSGTALWVPPEQRHLIDAMSALLACLVFAFVKDLLRWIEYGGGRREEELKANTPAELVPSPRATEPVRSRKRTVATAASYFLAFGSFFCGVHCTSLFMLLRNQCVYHFDARDWADSQLKPGIPGHSGPADVRRNAEFVDVDRQLIYLPEHLPPVAQDYLDHLGKNIVDPLSDVLEEEPDTLIDMLASKGGKQFGETNIHFMWLELSMIALFSATIACGEFNLVEYLGGLLGT